MEVYLELLSFGGCVDIQSYEPNDNLGNAALFRRNGHYIVVLTSCYCL